MARIIWIAGAILLGVVAAAAWVWVSGAKPAPHVVWERMAGPWIDEQRLLEHHEQHKTKYPKAADVYEWDWGLRLEHLLWPKDAALSRQAVAPRRTVKARADCVRELRWILKPAYVPADLAKHLVGISEYGRNRSDFLFGRYRVDEYRVQVIYSGHLTGILVVPQHPSQQPTATADYAMALLKALFVPMRAEQEGQIRVGSGVEGGIVLGGYTDSHAAAQDTFIGPSPWYGGSFLSDGSYVFVTPPKWAMREGLNIQDHVLGPEGPPWDDPILLFEPKTDAK